MYFLFKKRKGILLGPVKKNGKLILRKFCLSYTYTIDFKHVKKPKENLSIKNFNRTRIVKHCYGVLRLERKKKVFEGENTYTHTHILTYIWVFFSLGNLLNHFLCSVRLYSFFYSLIMSGKTIFHFWTTKTRFTLV